MRVFSILTWLLGVSCFLIVDIIYSPLRVIDNVIALQCLSLSTSFFILFFLLISNIYTPSLFKYELIVSAVAFRICIIYYLKLYVFISLFIHLLI